MLRHRCCTSYNLLLGRQWIHRNSIVPSTLHQVMKYIDGSGNVRTLIAERHPFKGVENYFTDSLLYQESVEIDEVPQPEEPDSGNEADTELEEDECVWELDPPVMGINKPDVDNTSADDEEFNTVRY